MKRIAILASGAGSNAANILNYFKSNAKVEVVLIASNRPNAGVLEIAHTWGIPTFHLTREDFQESDRFIHELQSRKVDVIVLAGFLWKVPPHMVAIYPQRIINIHPSLLPKYGGKGMFGHYVHEAVHAAQESESGITIHYVNEHYDQGAIIAQFRTPVLPDDTASDIERKVRALEMEWFPRVLEEVLTSC